MPGHFVAQLVASGDLKVLELEEPSLLPGAIPIYAVHTRDRPPGPAGKWFLDHLMVAFSSESSD